MAVAAPATGAPPAKAGPSRAKRSRVAYWLLIPGMAWLFAFWLWPTIQMGLVSLQTGTFEDGYALTWNFGIYGDVVSTNSTQLIRSVVYALIVTVITLAVGYPLAYGIATRG